MPIADLWGPERTRFQKTEAGVSGRTRASTRADVAGELSTDGAEVSTVCVSLYRELSDVEEADVVTSLRNVSGTPV